MALLCLSKPFTDGGTVRPPRRARRRSGRAALGSVQLPGYVLGVVADRPVRAPERPVRDVRPPYVRLDEPFDPVPDLLAVTVEVERVGHEVVAVIARARTSQSMIPVSVPSSRASTLSACRSKWTSPLVGNHDGSASTPTDSTKSMMRRERLECARSESCCAPFSPTNRSVNSKAPAEARPSRRLRYSLVLAGAARRRCRAYPSETRRRMSTALS